MCFDLVHTDLWGLTPVISSDGYRYYVLFVEDYNRYVWIYPLKQKTDTLIAFKHLVTFVQTQFRKTIKMLHSDNGGEYTKVHQVCRNMGIMSQFSCPYTSAHNGRVERKHQHVVEMGLTLLAQASMPLSFWWDAFLTATMLINGLFTPVLNDKSPFENLFKKHMDFSSLRILFGCACFPCLRTYQTNKFQFHYEKCVYLGPNMTYKRVSLLDQYGTYYYIQTR